MKEFHPNTTLQIMNPLLARLIRLGVPMGPMAVLTVAGRKTGLPRSTPLYFHCHRGSRSQAAAEHFIQQGFTEVYNLAGGIDAWSRDVDPGVKRY